MGRRLHGATTPAGRLQKWGEHSSSLSSGVSAECSAGGDDGHALVILFKYAFVKHTICRITIRLDAQSNWCVIKAAKSGQIKENLAVGKAGSASSS